MSGKRRILFIGLGWEQVDLARRLADAGHRVYGLSPLSKFFFRGAVADIRRVDPLQTAAVLAAAREWSVDAVVSDQCDYSRYAEETVAGRLGLSPLPAGTAVGVSKILQRAAAQRAGARQPAYRVCGALAQAEAAFHALGGDVVVKPADARGSLGVTRVRRARDMKPAYYAARRQGVVSAIMVERFVRGTLVTLDGLLGPAGAEVVAVSRSVHENRKAIVLKEHVFGLPGAFPEIGRHAEAVKAVCRAAGFRDGFFHSEWLMGKDGFTFIEIANRARGIRAVSRIYSPLTGRDLYAEAYPHLLAAKPFDKPCRYCVQTFHIGSGRLAGRHFMSGRARRDPRVLDYALWPNGGVGGDNGSDARRLGHATFGGDRLKPLLALARSRGGAA